MPPRRSTAAGAPRQQATAPPPPQQDGAGGVVAAAATAAAVAALAPKPGIPKPPGFGLVKGAAQTILNAMDAVFRERRTGFVGYVVQTAASQMPGAPAERVKALADEELRREIEFQRKARVRLEQDLPRVLAMADPQARAAALAQVVEREKRYLRQREEAAAQRLVAALEADLLKQASPLGAYWKLSPLVRNHCLRCLGMAEKFWPWEVIEAYPLPLHPNCACSLLSLDEAVGMGLMAHDQVPDPEDAIRRAKGIMRDAKRLEEQMAPEDLEALVSDLEGRLVQETQARQILRWGKGLVKGGEFAPTRGGGDRGKLSKSELSKIRQLALPVAPSTARTREDGHHVVLHGEAVHVPLADHWQHTVKGHTYSSPPGGTNIYRDGILIDHDHPDLGGPGLKAPGEPAGPYSHDLEVAAEKPLVDLETNPVPDYTGTDLALGKRAGGSTGAVWAFDAAKDRWLVKTYGGNQDRVATELLANAVYRTLGASTPLAGVLRMEGEPDFASIADVPVGDPPLPKGKRISTGIIVRDPDGAVWVYEPKGHFGGYEHTFPKGGLEAGLTPQQNAAKELWEETGLHAQITGYVGDYQGDTGISRYYLATRTGGDPHPDDTAPYEPGGSETAAVKRVTPEQAQGMLNRSRDKKVLLDALAMPIPAPVANAAVPGPTKVTALAYPTLPGETRKIEKPHYGLDAHYMTDALVANWDFIGLTDDNVLWGPDGEPTRIDQGGTFQYRAQGQPKPYGPVPTEVWTMLGPKGQGYGKVDVSESEMRSQARHIAETLTPEKVDQLVSAAPFADPQMREEIRQALKDRVAWMASFADGAEQIPKPLSGRQVAAELARSQERLEPSPEEFSALDSFLTDDKARTAAMASLRTGTAKDATPLTKTMIAGLDSLLRGTRTDEDIVAYRPIDPAAYGDLDKLVGRVMSDKGYLNATTQLGVARGAPGMLRLTVPAGSRALYTPAVEGIDRSELDPDLELVLARGSRARVMSVDTTGGRTVVNAVILP